MQLRFCLKNFTVGGLLKEVVSKEFVLNLHVFDKILLIVTISSQVLQENNLIFSEAIGTIHKTKLLLQELRSDSSFDELWDLSEKLFNSVTTSTTTATSTAPTTATSTATTAEVSAFVKIHMSKKNKGKKRNNNKKSRNIYPINKRSIRYSNFN